MKNDILANFIGHDHNNDFNGFYHKGNKTIDLHYGRKSGYGSYGPPSDILRGGKVIKLNRINRVI